MDRSELRGTIEEMAELLRREERQYAKLAWVWLKRHGAKPTTEDVEDVMEDAFLRAATKLRHDGVQVRNLGAWYARFLFYRCLEFARSKRRDDAFVTRSLDLEDMDRIQQYVADHVASEGDDGRFLRGILDTLSSEERKLLDSYMDGATSEQLAVKFNVTPAALRQRKHRILKKLEWRLKEDET